MIIPSLSVPPRGMKDEYSPLGYPRKVVFQGGIYMPELPGVRKLDPNVEGGSTSPPDWRPGSHSRIDEFLPEFELICSYKDLESVIALSKKACNLSPKPDGTSNTRSSPVITSILRVLS